MKQRFPSSIGRLRPGLPAEARTRSAAAGLTVVELTLTIAIITFLVALLYPVASAGRHASQENRCVANLRSIGAALLAVAAENNGRLPALGLTARAQQPTWGMATARAMGIDLTARGQITAFYCPLDRTLDTDAGRNSHRNHVGHSSYAMNINLTDWQEGASVHGGVARGGVRLGQIPNAAQTLMVVEVHESYNVISWSDAGGKTWQKGWTFEYTRANGTEANDPGKKGYHRGKNNWLFADGHVERLSFQETLQPVNLWQLIR